MRRRRRREDLVLDRAIRDWVLIPLSVVMVLIGVLRYLVSKLMSSYQLPDPKAAANFIPPKSFRARRSYFTNEENGLLFVPKGQAQNAQAQMFSDPNMAMDVMKKNLSMIIPQVLTPRIWLSSSSACNEESVNSNAYFCLGQLLLLWICCGYFLNLCGFSGLFSLILGEENAMDDTQRMMQMSGFGFDPSKSLGAEKDGLDIVQHEWALPEFEQRAEAALRKLVASRCSALARILPSRTTSLH